MKLNIGHFIVCILLLLSLNQLFGCKAELISPPADTTAIIAGTGTAGYSDGIGTAAQFNHPFGLTVDTLGNLYIADLGNSVIRKISTTAVVTTLAGAPGVINFQNGTGKTAFFNKPFGVAVDSAGNVYVADAGNNLIRKCTQQGVVNTFTGKGTTGSDDGLDTSATFNSPSGIAIDASGNLYVADYFNNEIRKITPAGAVSRFAGSTTSGASNGLDTMATFSYPEGVCVDASGNVYVADSGNNLIRKITPLGVVTTLAGSPTAGSANGTGTAASFNEVYSVGVDAAGNVYAADSGNNLIRKITAGGVVTTFAGSGQKGAKNGTGTSASFNNPSGVAVDKQGNVYIADTGNNLIRKITSGGAVTTIAMIQTFNPFFH